MKNILTFPVVFLILLLAGPTLSQEENLMGFYFDPVGDTDCLDSSFVPPFSILEMYLVLKNPSFENLYGFEAGFTASGNYVIVGFEFTVPDPIWMPTPDNIIIGFGSPMIMEEINLLVTYEILYSDTIGGEVCFNLHGTEPASLDPLFPTLLTDDAVLIAATVHQGSTGDCTALISDGPCVVFTSTHSWDSLKTLYR